MVELDLAEQFEIDDRQMRQAAVAGRRVVNLSPGLLRANETSSFTERSGSEG